MSTTIKPYKKPNHESTANEKKLADNAVRQVISNQSGPHKNLEATVKKHQLHTFRQPISGHTITAFKQVQCWLEERPERPLVLDTGCGTGMSTALLAEKHPNCAVIGIDRSLSRLNRNSAEKPSNNQMSHSSELLLLRPNACLVRADLIDFWRLAAAANWRLKHHYFLYPNPYPKSTQLQRRWHAHPVFPIILELGGEITVRSNWQTYMEEFVIALRHSGYAADNIVVQNITAACLENPLTLFEKKYALDGQALYQLSLQLS